MNKTEFLELANNAVKRWSNADLPKLPGKPNFKIVHHLFAEELEITPNIVAKYIGTTRTGKHTYLVDAGAVIEHINEYEI